MFCHELLIDKVVKAIRFHSRSYLYNLLGALLMFSEKKKCATVWYKIQSKSRHSYNLYLIVENKMVLL